MITTSHTQGQPTPSATRPTSTTRQGIDEVPQSEIATLFDNAYTSMLSTIKPNNHKALN